MKVLSVRGRGTLPGRVQAKVRGDAPRPARSQGPASSFAGASGRTGRRGTVVLWPPLELPGRFKAVARKDGRYGLSRLVEVAWPS